MESRHSSLSSAAALDQRPQSYRKRSNSFPLMEALGCTTDEARLILEEGNAAVRRRRRSRRTPSRRKRASPEQVTTFRPQDHIQYLYPSAQRATERTPNLDRLSLHSRTSSNMTDNSTSTITGPTQIATENTPTPVVSPGSPLLMDYSANLANFIRSQLASIPSNGYSPVSPRSCPDLSFPSMSPPQSPAKTKPSLPSMQMPLIRPPLQSQFSAWSSTDDDDEADNGLPELPTIPGVVPASHPYNDTPNEKSFFSFSTPLKSESEPEHPNIGGFEFPAPPKSSNSAYSSQDEVQYHSSASDHPRLTLSSAPSFSSNSTGSYFDFKRPMPISTQMKDRIIAAVSPHPGPQKTFTAISPYEGGAISNVHDVHVQSQHRVMVDGLSFDLVRDLKMPDENMSRVSTPC